MSTPINFRDFGGQRTADGRYVRRGRLFRSGHLGWLDAAAIAAMLAYDFDLVVDLRYLDERTEHVSPWRQGDAARVIFHDNAMDHDAPHLQIMRRSGSDLEAIDAAYASFYSQLPFDPNYAPLFVTAIERMARSGGRTLIHCSAGKDRTGTLAALILAVLGVEESAIVADYLRSNEGLGMEQLREHVRERYIPTGGQTDEGQVRALIGVKAAYIGAALDAVRERHGSIEAYLVAQGASESALEGLRAAYLTDAPGD
ncbi:tyrosine-protein phosphatase [Novosphingobium sp. 9U]|uniref:tyrosine-protein phosphatase n=1 Tax=Novosphingobium sp. 9U TaxID=2653158 RepID=UPI0012EF32A1|nr:tyrosine-protein phosphatase [Novosphingobium sp. 9U]VWX50200.1 putative tyrosine-protein phosphatase H16_A0669 [Novosphingobium sp. 9U]